MDRQVEFEIGDWVTHKHFNTKEKKLVVKVLRNGDVGARYLGNGDQFIYGEYHPNEIMRHSTVAGDQVIDELMNPKKEIKSVNDSFEIEEWVKHKHFNKSKKMLVVKKLDNGWYGTRYNPSGNILIYDEFHSVELEVFKEPELEIPAIIIS